jgi:hypothetical protein
MTPHAALATLSAWQPALAQELARIAGERQEDAPTRAEAIRRMIERALKD